MNNNITCKSIQPSLKEKQNIFVSVFLGMSKASRAQPQKFFSYKYIVYPKASRFKFKTSHNQDICWSGLETMLIRNELSLSMRTIEICSSWEILCKVDQRQGSTYRLNSWKRTHLKCWWVCINVLNVWQPDPCKGLFLSSISLGCYTRAYQTVFPACP